MILKELEEITETPIEVEYFHEQRRFTAKLRGAEVVDDKLVSTPAGSGRTPEQAQRNYAREIKGRRIRIDGREYKVPANLSA